jgi:hypothetical protein
MEQEKNPLKKDSSKRKSPLKIIIISVLVIGFLFVASVLSVIYFAWTMADVQMEAADQFTELMAGGRVAEAYALTNEEFQSETSQAELFKFLQHYPVLKSAEAEFTQFSISNDKTTVSGTLYGKNDSSAPITIWLEKIDGTWTISGLSLEEEDLL